MATKMIGPCEVCGKVRRLTRDSMLWNHSIPKSFPPVRCPGAGQPATEAYPQEVK